MFNAWNDFNYSAYFEVLLGIKVDWAGEHKGNCSFVLMVISLKGFQSIFVKVRNRVFFQGFVVFLFHRFVLLFLIRRSCGQ